MAGASWVDFVAQGVFHTLVASLVVEALVRLWRVRAPDQRIALRLLALGYPLLVLPAYVFGLPWREGEAFRDAALLAGRRWEEIQVLGVGLFEVFVATFAALGIGLLLMDLVPLVLGRRGGPPRPAPPTSAEGLALVGLVAEVAAAMRRPPPPLVFLEDGPPVLFCAGVRRPSLVASRATLRLLDPAEIRAALAHELGHLERRDPAASWALMAGRIAMAFNPAFQVMARAVARDAEWRADERAAAVLGDRLALASSLLKLYRATEGSPPARGRRNLPFAGALAEPLARARSLDIETRCRRLVEPAAEQLPFGALRVALVAASLSGLLFFVV